MAYIGQTIKTSKSPEDQQLDAALQILQANWVASGRNTDASGFPLVPRDAVVQAFEREGMAANSAEFKHITNTVQSLGFAVLRGDAWTVTLSDDRKQAWDQQSAKTPPPKVNFDNIPHELRELPRWVCWEYRPNPAKPNEKPSKVLLQARNVNVNASTTNPDTWATYEATKAAYKANSTKLAGVGFVLNGDGVAGVDIDKCVVDGVPSPEAMALLASMDARYIEVSPSGKGLRAFGYAKDLTTGAKTSTPMDSLNLELYTSGRYLTLTGNTLRADRLGDLSGFAGVAEQIRAHNEAIKAKVAKAKGPTPTAPQIVAGAANPAWVKATVAGCVQAITLAGEGGRNHALNENALRVFRIVEAGQLNETEAFNTLRDAGVAAGLGDAEVLATLRSARDGARTHGPCEIPAPKLRQVQTAQHLAIVDPETGEITAAAKPVARRKLPDYPAPYPGPMAALVAAANASAHKLQPGLSLLGVLIGMAGAIGGMYGMANGSRFNLYGVGSLESGAGKENPRRAAEDIAVLGNATILGKPGSGAGLEDALTPKGNILVAIDEVAHLLKAMNDPRAGSYLHDVGAVLLKTFSASAGTYHKRVLANKGSEKPTEDNRAIVTPCLSMLGFATPEGLGAAFNEANFTDGLMARMLFIQGDSDALPRRARVGFDIPDDVKARAKAIADAKQRHALRAIDASARPAIVVQEPDWIGEILDNWSIKLEQDRGRDLTVARSLYARSFEKLQRIAGVLAVWDNPVDPVLTLEHIEWAKAFVLASDAHMLDFVSSRMHSSETAKDAAKVREVIRGIFAGRYKPRADRPGEKAAIELGGVAWSHAMRASRLSAKEFEAAMHELHDLGEVCAFDGRHKLATVFGIVLD